MSICEANGSEEDNRTADAAPLFIARLCLTAAEHCSVVPTSTVKGNWDNIDPEIVGTPNAHRTHKLSHAPGCPLGPGTALVIL